MSEPKTEDGGRKPEGSRQWKARAEALAHENAYLRAALGFKHTLAAHRPTGEQIRGRLAAVTEGTQWWLDLHALLDEEINAEVTLALTPQLLGEAAAIQRGRPAALIDFKERLVGLWQETRKA